MPPRVNLVLVIWRDLGRHLFQVVLMLAILGTAMTTVVITNATRSLTASQNELLDERDQLDIEWRHLLLEVNALAEHSRVSDLARTRLQMSRPSPLQEQMVSMP